ncbi:hypothetical protein BT93_B1158 [Corymbia citriodora subsp. variegata]|nr:hypothetical protein BT93_B1158 [Corymbia citriodora subsp. variegata]
MSQTVHLSFPHCASFLSRRLPRRRRSSQAGGAPPPTPPPPSSSSSSRGSPPRAAPHEDDPIPRCEARSPVVLVERYGDGTAKRYTLHDNSLLKISLEEHIPEENELEGTHFADPKLALLPDSVKDFILPSGFPESVSDDYLQYMLLQFPTNVTAWICHALVTSSLLKAVGVGSFSGSTAAASAAAIRWVSKDGIGAVGRLLIGGRFGNVFDDDPKQWRMYADFIGSAGSIFDLTTQLYPAYFLPIASLGNLAKAVARGLKDPSFRVIQNHFASTGNVGEVAAKEEVWEVAAQLLGLAIGILILINLKRARILVKSHVLSSKVPGCDECNERENILVWQRFLKPYIRFGVPFEEMMRGEKAVSQVSELLKLYGKEEYILTVNPSYKDFEIFIAFKVGATSSSVLRGLWQANWLYENWDNAADVYYQLALSLSEMERRFEDFLQQLDEAGWDRHNITLRVPKEILIDQISAL